VPCSNAVALAALRVRFLVTVAPQKGASKSCQRVVKQTIEAKRSANGLDTVGGAKKDSATTLQGHRWSPGGAEADSPGQRPGNPPAVNTALKGRDRTALTHAISVAGDVSPLQGGMRGGGPTQGASPGLSSCAPPGLHTDLIRGQPHPDNSCLHPPKNRRVQPSIIAAILTILPGSKVWRRSSSPWPPTIPNWSMISFT
jgi:hypothetical protein